MDFHQPILLARTWTGTHSVWGILRHCTEWGWLLAHISSQLPTITTTTTTHCSSVGLGEALLVAQHWSVGSDCLFQQSVSITTPHLDPGFDKPCAASRHQTRLLWCYHTFLSFLFALPRSWCPGDLWVVWRSSKHYLRIIYMSCLFHLIMPFFNMLSSSFLAGSSYHPPNACLACAEAFLFFK